MPSANDLIRAAPRYLGVPYSKLDCQAFVEACLKDICISKNLPGSNAWYRTMTWVGTPEQCKQKFGEIPKGAFLYILKPSGGEPEKYKPDGIGNASHIGIYTGISGAEMCSIAMDYGNGDADFYNYGNGAIHSSSSRGCVCTSTFAGKAINGGWNRIGLWDKISYSQKVNGLLTGQKTPENGIHSGGEAMTATVFAQSGGSVNLRSKPTTAASLIERVPIGTQVTIISESGDWAYIELTGSDVRGYMMSEFLIPGEIKTDGTLPEDVVVKRQWLQDVYQQIGEYLGIRG